MPRAGSLAGRAFAAGFGHDTVSDFALSGSNSDVIQFGAAVLADFAAVQAAAHQEGLDTVVTIDHDTSLTLKNVQLTSLHAERFSFRLSPHGRYKRKGRPWAPFSVHVFEPRCAACRAGASISAGRTKSAGRERQVATCRMPIRSQLWQAMATEHDNALPPFRFPGVLNSQELLVAEAIHARAWHALRSGEDFAVADAADARDRLGRIVVQLMIRRTASTAELASAAIALFRGEPESPPQ